MKKAIILAATLTLLTAVACTQKTETEVSTDSTGSQTSTTVESTTYPAVDTAATAEAMHDAADATRDAANTVTNAARDAAHATGTAMKQPAGRFRKRPRPPKRTRIRRLHPSQDQMHVSERVRDRLDVPSPRGALWSAVSLLPLL